MILPIVAYGDAVLRKVRVKKMFTRENYRTCSC